MAKRDAGAGGSDRVTAQNDTNRRSAIDARLKRVEEVFGWNEAKRGSPSLRRLTTLGGHLKTGHRWTLQNRPMERNQNKSINSLGKHLFEK
jgi:hypothetical protein